MSTTTIDAHAPPPTQWDTDTYKSAAAFVPQLTTKILQLLDPQPTDRILDVGCGDGKFTAKYLGLVSSVVGVDASASFVDSANAVYGRRHSSNGNGGAGPGGQPKSRFEAKVIDCRFLDRELSTISSDAAVGDFDKVVSNAALHWILRDESTRLNTLKGCYAALKPGGKFVFEMGGAGNVAEMHVAFISALLHHTSCDIREAQEFSPWFFPDVKEMTAMLQEVGFVIDNGLELEYRPTRMETSPDGKPNLEGWVRVMGKQFLDRAEKEGKSEQVVREVCDVVATRGVTMRSDGSGEFGYVRLRGVASKPL